MNSIALLIWYDITVSRNDIRGDIGTDNIAMEGRYRGWNLYSIPSTPVSWPANPAFFMGTLAHNENSVILAPSAVSRSQ